MSDLLLAEEREAVASAARHLAEEGLVIGTAGNISARNGDLVAVTPTGANLGQLTAGHDHGHRPDRQGGGRQARSHLRGASAHRYRRGHQRPGCHPRPRHGLDGRGLYLRRATAPSLQLPEPGRCPRTAPYATFGSPELAQNVITALKGRNAALMENHGSVAYGSTMDEAVERLKLLEWLAELYWRASSLGTPRILTDKDFEAIIMAAISGGYGAMHEVDES